METRGRNRTLGRLLLFFGLSYLLSWGYLVPQVLVAQGLLAVAPPPWLEVVAAYGPALAALVTLGALHRREAAALFLGMFRVRVGARWYLTALLMPPAFMLGALGLGMLLGGPAPDFASAFAYGMGLGVHPGNAWLAVAPYLIVQMVSVLGEELGWRGYALPRLLQKHHWLIASLILGLGWALWHAPMFFIPGTVQSEVNPILYNLDLLVTTFLMTWLMLWARGSVVIATLYHAGVNTWVAFIPIIPLSGEDPRAFIAGIALKVAFVAVVAIRQGKGAWLGTPPAEDGETQAAETTRC